MLSRSDKAFSLVEVLITVAILSSAVVFIFRGFTASLQAAKLSQNITLACLLAEDRLWELELRQQSKLRLPDSSEPILLQNQEFNWVYEIKDADYPNLKELVLTVSWQESRRKNYALSFLTYLLQNEKE